MSDNWVVQNLENALNTWNEKLAEIWQLITQSPENFKGGTIWNVIVDIHGAVQAIGLALLVLFFVVGVMRTCGNLYQHHSVCSNSDIHYCSGKYGFNFRHFLFSSMGSCRRS